MRVPAWFVRSWVPARRSERLVAVVLGAAAWAPHGSAQTEVTVPTSEVLRRDLGFACADSGLRYRVCPIPNATHAAIVAAVRVGPWHDPAGQTGLTYLLNTQIGLTQEERPELERWTIKTVGPATVVALTCPTQDLEARLRELARFLGGELPFDEDLLARAKAQVLVRADDYLNVIPGPLLIENARRTLGAGTPAGKQMFGVVDELRALGRGDLEAWFKARMRPEHTTLVVIGGLESAAVEAVCRQAFVAPGERTAPAALTVHDSAAPVQRESRHGRIAAPFVSVAIQAPAYDSPEWLPFVVAMGVVAVRCQRTFGAYRGREAEAAFPFTWYDYRHGDGFALINRRGANEEDGAITRDVDAVRRELQAVIKRLRTVAPDLGEVQRAAFEASTSLMLPPYEGQLDAMARYPGLLMPRGELLAMADVLGWPATVQADIGKVPVSEVMRVLHEALADDRLTWFALVPGE